MCVHVQIYDSYENYLEHFRIVKVCVKIRSQNHTTSLKYRPKELYLWPKAASDGLDEVQMCVWTSISGYPLSYCILYLAILNCRKTWE